MPTRCDRRSHDHGAAPSRRRTSSARRRCCSTRVRASGGSGRRRCGRRWSTCTTSGSPRAAAAIGLTDRAALVAVGALGRRELAPYSDLDLVLLHDGRKDVDRLAEELWYPLWNSGIGLDHSVRTPGQAVQVAATDLRAAFGLLEARHLAGDPELSEKVKSAVRQAWRAGIRGRFDEIADGAHDRWRKSGDVAHRVEPDLKSGHGGLRDVQLIDALAAAQLVDRPSRDVLDGRDLLLNVPHGAAPHGRARPRRAARAGRRRGGGEPRHRRPLRARPGACPGPRAPSRSPPRSDCARRATHCRAGGSPHCGARRCAVRSTAASSSTRGGRAGPRRHRRPRSGAGAARGRDRRPHRAPGGRGHPAPARRHRARAAGAVAAGGAWASCCPCWAPGVRWWTSWSRSTAPACGVGCSRSGAPCATSRRATARTSGPSTGTSWRPARRRPGSPPRSPGRTCC